MGRKAKNKKKKWQNYKPAKAGGVTHAFANTTPAEDTPDVAADKFKLNIPEKIFEKVMYWINKASPNEVSGFGTLAFDENTREFTVTDAYLLKQEVSGGSAEIDEDAIAKSMFQRKDEVNAHKWHWHSHPTFGVFWSGTDRELIEQLGRQGWIVATVLNCKKEMRTAFLTSVDLMGKPHDIFVDDFKTEVVQVVDANTRRAYDKEYDATVETKTYRTYTPSDDRKPHTPFTPHHYIGKRYLFKDDYDKDGYAQVDGDYVYNPIYDKNCPTKEQQFAMINEMKPDEIKFLEDRDYKFECLVKEYYVAMVDDNRFNQSGAY